MTRAEHVPDSSLNLWIKGRRYISPGIIDNEFIEMMGNAVLRSILQDIKENSGLFRLIADESRDVSCGWLCQILPPIKIFSECI